MQPFHDPFENQFALDLLNALQQGDPLEAPGLMGHPLSLAAGYRVAAQVMHGRLTSTNPVAGWKVGFTNRTIWDQYQVFAPVIGPMYRSSVIQFSDDQSMLDSLTGIHEPRIEPEIVFEMAACPLPSMSDEALFACVRAIGHGFEIVTSPFPDWKFTAPDAVAAGSLHARLLVGPMIRADQASAKEWIGSLRHFSLRLFCDATLMDTGHASHVLEGPLSVLRHLAEVLADPATGARFGRGIAPGDLITTGTVTKAFPIRAGQCWSTQLTDLPTPNIRVKLG